MNLLSYFKNLVKKNISKPTITKSGYEQYSSPKHLSEEIKTVLDSHEFAHEQMDSFQNLEAIDGVSNKTNRDRVVAVIESNKGTHPVFTTTMVYGWLYGNMSILSVRKCIYKLQTQGYLEHCKKTIGSNKRVKYYSIKNSSRIIFVN